MLFCDHMVLVAVRKLSLLASQINLRSICVARNDGLDLGIASLRAQ